MTRTDAFRALHRAGDPLLLPNGWDHASIAALAAAGFAAVGTTSLGVAAAVGKPDAAGSTLAETLDLARRTSGLCLLSVDLEGGFGGGPGAVAELAAELAAAGVVGVNIEDGRADGTLADLRSQARLIAAVKERVPDLFVNARTDTFWLGGSGASLGETTERIAAYAGAGADGVFVPGLADGSAIVVAAAAVEVPLNVLYSPTGPDLARLSEIGVGRVSLGSLLFRVALGSVTRTAAAIARSEHPVLDGIPTYEDVAALLEARG